MVRLNAWTGRSPSCTKAAIELDETEVAHTNATITTISASRMRRRLKCRRTVQVIGLNVSRGPWDLLPGYLPSPECPPFRDLPQV
jgi:hypothetical protein